MRWSPGGRSSDIEDDRDQSSSGGGGLVSEASTLELAVLSFC
jgi:hypothetical protein